MMVAVSAASAQNDPGPTPMPAPKPTIITEEMAAEMNRNMDEPSPDTLPMPDDPNLAKVAFFRVWYLGGPGSPRISLALEDDKKKNPARLIEVGLTAGNVIASYLPEAPGTYTLHILDGSVFRPTDPKAPLPLDERKLQLPMNFVLDPGVYTTVVLVPEGDKIKVQTVDQKPLARGAMPELRVRNFSTLAGWSIRVKGGKGSEKEIWNPAVGTDALLAELPVKGRYEIAVYVTKDGITRNVDTFPDESISGRSRSIVLHDGLGGWGGFQTVLDAHPGTSYDPSFIKTLAQGSN